MTIAGMAYVAIAGRLAAAVPKSRIGKIDDVTCFPPGTLILMGDGTTKAIEDVEIGEYVLTDDPEDGQGIKKQKVVNVIKNKTKRFIHIIFDTDSDTMGDGEFRATGEHPIWTKNRGWIFSKDLIAGDLLKTNKKEYVTVVSTWEENIISDTYNLSIEGVHTFFIVSNQISILVHNDPPRIHGVAPDWAQKGVHVTSNGIELKVTSGGNNIRIKPVFSSDLNNPGLKKAIHNVEKALQNKDWRKSLLEKTRSATKYLGNGDKLAKSTSGSTRALEVALERWCK